jgi:beta-mannosidase
MKIRLQNCLFFFLIPLVICAQNSQRNLSSEAWNFKKKSDVNWLPATVPGTVHTDLFHNKIIPDPFYGFNEKQLQWIENEDWEYQTTFSISQDELNNENCLLQFDGLDTYAEVFLNNEKILEANNMFRTWKIGVKNQLQLGQNTLRIVFSSAVKKGKEAAVKLPYILPGDEKIFTRKAQYQFGWDWGPRFVTAGICKDIKLHFCNSATISNVKYNQKTLNDAVAELEFTTTIQSTNEGKFQLKINDKIEEVQLQKGENKIAIPYQIQNPKRWWSNGLGEAFLYSFSVELLQNETVLSNSELAIGLRTIELIQEDDKMGKSFYFKLNGVPVFMKGANYIPTDSFIPKSNDSVYKSIVKNAVTANMNMLRVWGGGVYADDAFYNECDKNGILVWQDFMFACAMYPGDETFLDNVKQEVIDNVSRLQNHPCIALWCGNNESDEGWHNWGWQKQYNYSAEQEINIWNDYKRLFHEIIPQTLSNLLSSNENRYWPSSPSIGWGRNESLLQGDSHYWGVWWGMEPFEMYEKKVGRFMSEYGFQGMPNLETFKSFASATELNLESETVKSHQKHPTGYTTINEYIARDYQIPKSFENYIYVSQLLQAKGMKMSIEAHRRAKPYCMGTLFWQLNDCWPVTSWSSADYFGRWKALHYQVKKSFESVLISVQEEKEAYKVYIVNDDLKTYDGELQLQVLNFKGKKLLEMNKKVNLSENSSVAYLEILKSDLNRFSLKDVFLSMQFSSNNKNVKTQYYFVKPKELQLMKPNIKIKKVDANTIEITSNLLAKNVFLSSKEAAFFSDNFFDLLPNEKVKITLSKPSERIEVLSLFDTKN